MMLPMLITPTCVVICGFTKGETPKIQLLLHVQYCAREMQTKFDETSEITRISVMKLRTFVSDEKAANFQCFYCSNVGEISQAR